MNDIPDYMLERYLLKELPEKKMELISASAEQNTRLQERIHALETSNQEILEKFPPLEMSKVLQNRIQDVEIDPDSSINLIPGKKPFFRRFFMPSISFAALAAAFVLFLIITPFSSQGTEPLQFTDVSEHEITRIKGLDSKLFVYRKQQGMVEVLNEGSVVDQHDLLQIAYFSTADQYGVIFSIDGRGTVTMHYPQSLNSSSILETQRKQDLPYAYELDDAPVFEKFFFITSKNELDVQALYQSARIFARNLDNVVQKDMQLPRSVHQYSLTLYKEDQND